MKQCSRRNKETLERCGKPFEGSGSYCKDCRNEYQREYYAERKNHPLRSRTAELNLGCDVCGVGLRSNTLQTIEHPLLVKSMKLCPPCKATVTYAGETVDEETTEALVDAILTLSRITHSASSNSVRMPSVHDTYASTADFEPQLTLPPRPAHIPISKEEMARRAAQREAEVNAYWAKVEEDKKAGVYGPLEPYEPKVLVPGNVEECGACDKPARPGKKYCEDFATHEREMKYDPGELDI